MGRIFNSWRWVSGWLLGILLTASGATLISRQAISAPAGEPASTAQAVKVSDFAPADDLIDQVHYLVQRLDESLASRDDFDEARQSRVAKEADVVAVLGLGLTLHDSQHALRNSAPWLISASQSLASAGGDYEVARKALGALKDAAANKTDADIAAKPQTVITGWKPIAPLGLLMKEVPIVQSNLKRSIQGDRFKSQAKQSAGAAATLAVIAQEIMADESAVKDPAQRPKWQAECAELRDAAGAVNHAIHAADLEATKSSLSRLAHSCEACHADFRKSH
jgi:hypothetical protein